MWSKLKLCSRISVHIPPDSSCRGRQLEHRPAVLRAAGSRDTVNVASRVHNWASGGKVRLCASITEAIQNRCCPTAVPVANRITVKVTRESVNMMETFLLDMRPSAVTMHCLSCGDGAKAALRD
jgi:hypothetical protein